jgi:hypothetical protein
VTADQARAILAAADTVTLRDFQGQILFSIAPRPVNAPDGLAAMRSALRSFRQTTV